METGNKVAGVEAKVDMLLEEVRELRKTMNTNYVPRQEVDERFRSQGERLGKIEANVTWVTRLTIGWIIIGVLAAVFISNNPSIVQ